MDSSPFGTDTHRPLTAPLCLFDWSASCGSPVPLLKFQIPPYWAIWPAQGPRKRNTVCVIVTKVSHSHKTWVEVSLTPPTPLAHWAVGQSNYVEISSQGVMSSKNTLDCIPSKDTGLVLASGLQPSVLKTVTRIGTWYVAFPSKDFKNKIIAWVLILRICLTL